MRHINRRSLILLLLLALPGAALAIVEPPSTAPDLRNAYGELKAVPGAPDVLEVNFNDAAVLLRAITVEPTTSPADRRCRALVHINGQLAKVLITEPPSTIGETPLTYVGISEPPTASPAVTWQALLDPFGIDEPPGGIVFSPDDSLTVSLVSASTAKEATCAANVLVLGSVWSDALAGQVTPLDPSALRSQLVSLQATAGNPVKVDLGFFDDPQVLVRSYDVLATRLPGAARCRTTARINGLLARIQIREPPSAIAGIVQPPSGIAGIVQPPTGIVFTPTDVLQVGLESVPLDKDKDKDKDTGCAVDILVLATAYSNGQ